MSDLRARIVELVAPTTIGDELSPGVRLVDASSELGLALSFEVGGRVVRVEIARVEEARPCVARTARFSFAYRVDGDGASLGRVAAEICERVAACARVHEDAVLARIAHDAAESRDESGARVRLVRVERLLERAGPIDERYLTLSPYVGCVIGCRFCYAQERVASARRFEGAPEVAWGSFVDVRINAPEVLARELADAPRWPIKFCPIVSDPYHAVEARYEVTARCLDVLAREQARTVLVLTRSKLIERDAARLATLPRGHAGMSIPTIDDDVRRRFEPRAASIAERLAVLRSLRATGVRTFAVVQPILPGAIDALADALADAVSSVRIDVLHGVHGARDEFDAEIASDAWQRERAESLARALTKRGVRIWPGELPPDQ
jgi:DNA repair photolyase